MGEHEPSDGRGTRVLIIGIVFPALAFSTVLLRYYTRIIIMRNFALEDWFIGVAMLISIIVCTLGGICVRLGVGHRTDTVPPADFLLQLKLSFAAMALYTPAICFTKLSILIQYLRITISTSTRRIIYGVILFVIAYSIEAILTHIFTCTPVKGFWDIKISRTCMNRFAQYFANGGINIATDFIVLALPAIILKDLKLPLRPKLAVMGILALGGAGCLFSILRLHAIYLFSKSTDMSYNVPNLINWSVMEFNIGIICASLCTIRPFFARFMPTMFGSSTGTGDPKILNFTWTKASPHQPQGDFDPLSDECVLRKDSKTGEITMMEMGVGTHLNAQNGNDVERQGHSFITRHQSVYATSESLGESVSEPEAVFRQL